MSFRQDKLVLLIDTGTSSQVRRTAAQQLSELTLKTFRLARSDPSSSRIPKDEPGQEDVKPSNPDTVTLHAVASEEEAWSEVLETISKLVPLLRSRQSESRAAAANALGLLAKCLPSYEGATTPVSELDTSPVDLPDLLRSGTMLLASAGREYIAKPGPGDKAHRRKAMMGSLGLSEGVGWGEEVDRVIGDDDDDVDMAGSRVNGAAAGPSGSATPAADPPRDIFEGLSARQVTMLKRKKGNIIEEAKKSVYVLKFDCSERYRAETDRLRKLNAQMGGNSQTAQSTPSASNTPAASPMKNPSPLPPSTPTGSSEVVTIDPGAKARAQAASGGAVDPVLDSEGNAITEQKYQIKLQPGRPPWETTLLELTSSLSDAAWQSRHGSALGIMEILRSLPSPPLNELIQGIARQLLILLALDRFGDFLGDTVVAPVRETSAQCLGICLKYLDRNGVLRVHETLVGMVRQEWAKRGKEAEGRAKWEKFSWEIRHAGLLGLKYEVAVRGDLLRDVKSKLEEGDVKPKIEEVNGGLSTSNKGLLEEVVSVAVLALKDVDDDVRTVAASTLLPIAERLATDLPISQFSSVFDTLWGCLAEGGDELGSSVGAIMDLLGSKLIRPGALAACPGTVELLANHPNAMKLIGNIYSYTRHTIASVRLAVVNVLLQFLKATNLDALSWLESKMFDDLMRNLILETNPAIREASWTTFKAGIEEVRQNASMDDAIDTFTEEWLEMIFTPVGQLFDKGLFGRDGGKGARGHNVDKAMIAGDLGLVDAEVMWTGRLMAAKAYGLIWSNGSSQEIEERSLGIRSASAYRVLMESMIIQEWAAAVDTSHAGRISSLAADNEDAGELSQALIKVIESPPKDTYGEMSTILARIQAECQSLLSSFATEGKLPKDRIPVLPKKVDASKAGDAGGQYFTLATAQQAITTHFDALTTLLGKKAQSTALPILRERRNKVIVSIGYYGDAKEKYDVRVAAGVAGAIVSLRTLPAKFGGLIKAIMDSVRTEEVEVLQTRSASSIAAFIAFCCSPLYDRPADPTGKIIRNLFTFLCSDTAVTPVFKPDAQIAGIITYQEERDAAAAAAKKRAGAKDDGSEDETENQREMRISRRGALQAFRSLASLFGAELFVKVPKLWDGIATPLLNSFKLDRALEETDHYLRATDQAGQDVVDALTSLRLIIPDLDLSLHSHVTTLLPAVVLALQSSFAVIRHTASKCLAALCDVIIDESMRVVIDQVVPLVGDAKRVHARQGAVEAIHHIIRLLDIKALPYVLFLIVPILGRMSDPDEHVRLLSTSTFASLIEMVPLEAGIPDPPNFSPELLAKRDEERKFLMQLLDGSKAEQYQIPIDIKAELRQYQKDGVSWLAFLAKYQLHGILCDDMGLGKSLQSICIIGSKHHERKTKYLQSQSVDSAHLPSLIVCPPTLTGHWYYEIQKFTDDLRPFQYVGGAGERAAARASLTKYDVVIASYETVRSDVEFLGRIDWLYCVLDEGHIIKNSKTKLAAAVKQIRAQHRLMLSGTPIQNNLLELWSLFDFLMPGFLGSERGFQERYGKPVMADREGKATAKERDAAAVALEALHKQVLPFLLRRLKEDVLSDLPPKIIQDYYCNLSPIQALLYDEFSKSRAAEEAGVEIEDDTGADKGAPAGKGHVFQSLQYLRKLCNHPALVLDGEEGKRRWEELRGRAGVSKEARLRDLENAPKLEALKQLLNDCGIGIPAADKLDESPSHRVLIFCQLRPMLDLIENTLFAQHMPTVSYMRLDGSTDPKKRHAIVQTYNADSRIDVLLLTTSVGGLGLNLTGADTVIFVDHDWNPMKDLQAMDRAHRLGQRKVVNVYRLIMRGTLEEKIMGLQRFKLNIASSVVTQQNAGLGSMNTGEVLDLFRVSADGDPVKPQKQSAGPASAAKILEGLEDLPPEDEYADLSLSNFLSKV